VDAQERRGTKGAAAQTLLWFAVADAWYGNREQARQLVDRALTLERGRSAFPATALAITGDLSRAQAMADDLSRRYPLDTLLNDVGLAQARATVELQRKNPARALERLESTRAYEAGDPGPSYLRGLAHLQSARGSEAAAEFQQSLKKVNVTLPFDPVQVMARVALAHAYTLQGDTASARKAYQDFFALWKDADPDVPILKEAKAEYAKLQ
jgi:tetratricopeptide (TPR) repeat protein